MIEASLSDFVGKHPHNWEDAQKNSYIFSQKIFRNGDKIKLILRRSDLRNPNIPVESINCHEIKYTIVPMYQSEEIIFVDNNIQTILKSKRNHSQTL